MEKEIKEEIARESDNRQSLERNISGLSDQNVILEIKNLTGKERKITAQILRYLCEVRRRRLFALYGYSSLFGFCVKFLGYTEAQTQRRLEAMKAISEIPEIEGKIKEGSLSLTAVAQAQGYFRSQEKENKTLSVHIKKEVFQSLENKSTRECEKVLIELNLCPTLPKDKLRSVTPTHSQSIVTLPNDVLKKMDRIKSLLSHKNPQMTQAELLNEMSATHRFYGAYSEVRALDGKT